MSEVHYPSYRNARRIEKYAKEKCCVCGKYGAEVPFDGTLPALLALARENALTLKLPQSGAIHDKCLRKFKAFVNFKRGSLTNV
jgi:hypothetical protein